MMNIALQVFGILLGAAATIIGTLVLWNFKLFEKRLDSQENDIAEIQRNFAACKIDCERNNVSKEDWVRSEAFTRSKLDGVAATLNRMEGKLDIVDKIPQIAGNIASEIAGQMRPGG